MFWVSYLFLFLFSAFLISRQAKKQQRIDDVFIAYLDSKISHARADEYKSTDSAAKMIYRGQHQAYAMAKSKYVDILIGK